MSVQILGYGPRLTPSLHVTSVLVTAPAPLLSLAEGKTWAAVSWANADPRESLMTTWIAAAVAKVQKDTGVALLTQTWDVRVDAIGAGPLMLPLRPVQSVDVFASDELTENTLAADAYLLDPGSVTPFPARLAIPGARAMTVRSSWPWRIRAVVGFDTVDELRDHAPELIAAVGVLVGHYSSAGRDIVQIGHIVQDTPMSYDDLIAPYRIVYLP